MNFSTPKISISQKRKSPPPFTEEHRRKLGDSHRGKHYHSEETRKKMSLQKMGDKNPAKRLDVRKKMVENHTKGGWKFSEEIKKKFSEISLKNGKIPPSYKGYKHSEKSKIKMSLARKGRFCGENSPTWLGGISNNPYPSEFNNLLKLKIRQRDNFTCCLCKRTEREELEELNRVLCVNHIDFDKNNLKENNLNTLCLRCNVKINRNREYWTEYFNSNL